MRLTSISIYPIKGTRAIALQEAEVRTRGLVSDRRWLVVDESGRFITQRTHPRIGLVSTTVRDNGDLIVTAPDMEPMPVAARGSDERVTVTVWDDTVQAASVSRGGRPLVLAIPRDELPAWSSWIRTHYDRLRHSTVNRATK